MVTKETVKVLIEQTEEGDPVYYINIGKRTYQYIAEDTGAEIIRFQCPRCKTEFIVFPNSFDLECTPYLSCPYCKRDIAVLTFSEGDTNAGLRFKVP